MESYLSLWFRRWRATSWAQYKQVRGVCVYFVGMYCTESRISYLTFWKGLVSAEPQHMRRTLCAGHFTFPAENDFRGKGKENVFLQWNYLTAAMDGPVRLCFQSRHVSIWWICVHWCASELESRVGKGTLVAYHAGNQRSIQMRILRLLFSRTRAKIVHQKTPTEKKLM